MDTITFLQAKVTKTAAFTGAGLDVSLIPGDYTVFIRVINLVGTVRFAFTDSLDSFATDKLTGPTFSMKGTFTSDNPVVRSFLRRDFPSLRMGTVGAKLRLDVLELTGDATKTVTYEAWIQYNALVGVFISPESQTFLAAGGAGSINLVASGAWSVDPAPGWVVCTPTSGTGSANVSYTVAVNATGLPRQAFISFSGSNQLTVNQGAA